MPYHSRYRCQPVPASAAQRAVSEEQALVLHCGRYIGLHGEEKGRLARIVQADDLWPEAQKPSKGAALCVT